MFESLGFWLLVMSIWLLSIWGTVLLVDRQLLHGRAGGNTPSESPLDVAKRNYADGQLSKAEFDQIRAQLHAAADNDFISYPTNYMFGVVDDAAEARAAVGDLVAFGIRGEGLAVFSGQEGALRLDASGSHHGFFARLVRLTQAVSMDQDHSTKYEDEARQGHAVVAVRASGAEEQQAARAILKQHDGHFINWYGRFAFETLDP